MKTAFFLLLFFFNLTLNAQRLKGVVTDSETGQPVASASVFLSNTSVGTTTSTNGAFELLIPAGKFDLVVSSIGYDTYSQLITATTQDSYVAIKMTPKARELETVVVAPFEKDGWAKWGQFFIENFIGTSAYAADCKIKNSGTIRFRHSKKTNELTAYALEPLIIENKALGYTIRYQLETFQYDFTTRYILYQGYPFFEPMQGGEAKQKRWAARRSAVYHGSMMHFMRHVYRNTLGKEGFEVRRLQKIPNTEKQRVKAVYAANRKTVQQGGVTGVVMNAFSKDSSDYYTSVLRQEDYFDKIGKEVLPGDSFAYALDSTTAGLDFTDYLLVIYTKALAPAEYQKHYPKNGTAMASQITLINGMSVGIQANGSYYSPEDLLSSGYWSWSEKIATMLPFDYKVQ